MDCINCDGVDAEIFFIEQIKCDHCGEVSDIEYHVCTDCNIMWKTLGEELIHTSFDTPDESEDFFMNDAVTDALIANVSSLGYEEKETSMASMVHKCIRCNSIAYEIKPKYYHCTDCDFEWEIL